MTTGKLAQQALHRRTEADARAPAFYAATYDTKHYSFEAYGLTADSCRDAMRRTLEEHATVAFPAEGAIITAFVDGCMEDVVPQRRAMGEGYRDHQCITGGK